jgi:hypothetical protein
MIKKHKNRNEYYYAGNGLWVRNFTKKLAKELDINNLISENDTIAIMANEAANRVKMLQNIDTESFSYEKIAIISDGYKFNEEQDILAQLPNDVIIIGVHNTINLWNNSRRMNYYVVNNPYQECLRYYCPQPKVFPRYIASLRTNPEFLEGCKNIIYTYSPVNDEYYSGLRSDAEYYIDDYRNAICAAVGLSYHFNVKKLALLWCDDVFTEGRAGAEQLPNGLWLYPQQRVAHNLIDANLYWLKKMVNIGYMGSVNFNNGVYIKKDSLASFFS